MLARMTEAGKYRMAWKSKITGATGHGLPSSLENLDALAKQMNEECPDLDHWAEPVSPDENEKDATGQ